MRSCTAGVVLVVLLCLVVESPARADPATARTRLEAPEPARHDPQVACTARHNFVISLALQSPVTVLGWRQDGNHPGLIRALMASRPPTPRSTLCMKHPSPLRGRGRDRPVRPRGLWLRLECGERFQRVRTCLRLHRREPACSARQLGADLRGQGQGRDRHLRLQREQDPRQPLRAGLGQGGLHHRGQDGRCPRDHRAGAREGVVGRWRRRRPRVPRHVHRVPQQQEERQDRRRRRLR